MFLLLLLVAGAACLNFPSASYRLNDTKATQRNPRVVGFFIEDGVNKLGIDLFAGHYHTYDCDGKDHKIIKRKKTIGRYNCTIFLLGNAAFQLNASLRGSSKPLEIIGIFDDNFQELHVMTPKERRRFTIETDNGSTRKALPRAIYRLKNPKDVSKGNPPEIAFFTENNVERMAMEINKFYFSYICDNERHFHYENKKLMVSYECASSEFLLSPQLVLLADIRKPRTEVYSIANVYGQEVKFLHSVDGNSRNLEYEITSDGVAEGAFKPIELAESPILPTFLVYPQEIDYPIAFPDAVESSINDQGVGVIRFYKGRGYYSMLCDGKKREITELVPKSRERRLIRPYYVCTAEKDEKQRKTNVDIIARQYIRYVKFMGTFSFDDESLTLASGNGKPLRYANPRLIY